MADISYEQIFSKGFFLDNEKNHINPTLIGEKADEIGFSWTKTGLTQAQLRNFFQEMRELQLSFKEACQGETDKSGDVASKVFPKFLPLIRLVVAKVAYNRGRQMDTKRKEDPLGDFFSFIKNGIFAIKDYKDFEAFMLIFEAVVGYHKGYGGKD